MIDFTGVGFMLTGVAALIGAIRSDTAARRAKKAAEGAEKVKAAVETPPGTPSIGQQVHEAKETLNGRTVGFQSLVDTQVRQMAVDEKISSLLAALVAEHVEKRPKEV